jgi:diaminohydroxyphosphoribosylaminopyrimidine deaminase/5-amino-6-(5-phosphoribosylamino)uracil reductase
MSELNSSFMDYALRLARRGVGNTWPNPAVGAVVVKDGHIIGAGVTARAGRPHAETTALAQAGEQARGATLYVTLEPCAHQGKTPPCTQAIIHAGITHVVAAVTDPHPKVAGKGFAQLRAAGIRVTEKIGEAQALAINEGFFSVINRKRPHITLKLATSLDGKIADAKGKSKWITGEASRARGHLLRAQSDAIITGIGTLLADNPELNCRIAGREGDSPQRIVMDGNLRTPVKSRLMPAWIITSRAAIKSNPRAEARLTEAGASLFTVTRKPYGLLLEETVKLLAEKGITRLMVEAGGRLASAFIEADLVDRIYWFRAPLVIGEKGMAAIACAPLPLARAPRYSLQSSEQLGNDTLQIYDIEG